MSISASFGNQTYEFDTNNDYQIAKSLYHKRMTSDEFEHLLEEKNVEFIYDIGEMFE